MSDTKTHANIFARFDRPSESVRAKIRNTRRGKMMTVAM